MTFIADSMLGKLARWLRILGYDTAYDAFAEDDDLIRQAELESRILLTRDGPLAERAPEGRCIRIVHDHLDDQIAQLVDAVGLDLNRKTFTRCLVCNDPIVEISPEEARDRVPPYVFQTQTRFHMCPTCNRVYWQGTHLDRMAGRLEQIRARAGRYARSLREDRKRSCLMREESPQYAVGIDVGGSFIKAALVTPSGEIERQDRCPTDVGSGAEGVADRIADLVNGLVDRKGFALAGLEGVGIGVPGVTTPDGVVVLAPNLNWRHVRFKRLLAERLGTRVELDNDANVAALAEARVGAGGGCDTFVLFTLGTGIGGGIILNGRVHHGASHSAGEVGHVCVVPDGPLCGCGKKGCLEAVAAGPAMVRDVRRRLAEGQISDLTGAGDLTPEAICRAAGEGDALALETIAHVARYLGIAIANIIALLSPDVVAIGGGISAAGDVLLNPIVEAAKAESLEGMFDYTKIVPATLGNDAGSLGAAFLVL